MSSRFWRWHVNGLVLLAAIGIAVGLCTGCASVPQKITTSAPQKSKTSAPQRLTSLRACTFAIMQRGGERVVFYERAKIVGEVAGKHEWWLNLIDREPVFDKEGHARAVNFPKERVLRVGEVRLVGTSVCKCPESFR
jgi:hypothetical protein